MTAVQPLLSGVAGQCEAGGTGDIIWRQRELTPAGVRVVVASCFTGNAEFPAWVAELTPQGPRPLLALNGGSNCFPLPTQRNGHPDLWCSARLNAGERIVTVLIFAGGAYGEGLSLKFEYDLVTSYVLTPPIPPEDPAPSSRR